MSATKKFRLADLSVRFLGRIFHRQIVQREQRQSKLITLVRYRLVLAVSAVSALIWKYFAEPDSDLGAEVIKPVLLYKRRSVVSRMRRHRQSAIKAPCPCSPVQYAGGPSISPPPPPTYHLRVRSDDRKSRFVRVLQSRRTSS